VAPFFDIAQASGQLTIEKIQSRREGNVVDSTKINIALVLVISCGLTVVAHKVDSAGAQHQCSGNYWEIIADNLSKAVWSWAVSQQLIPTGERSGLQIQIRTMESVSSCVRMKS